MKFKLTYSLLYLLIVCASCNNMSENLDKKKTNSINSNLDNNKNKKATKLTKICFNEDVYDFGNIKEGDSVNKVFTFKNEGGYDLTIEEASSFCGCTVPSWSKEKIAPGDNGEIDVHFHKSGDLGKQDRIIIIKANTEPKYTTISIKANILALNTK